MGAAELVLLIYRTTMNGSCPQLTWDDPPEPLNFAFPCESSTLLGASTFTVALLLKGSEDSYLKWYGSEDPFVVALPASIYWAICLLDHSFQY